MPPGVQEGGRNKKAKKSPVSVDIRVGNYQPTLSDAQNLILRVFTSEYGENPKWVCIRGMNLIRTAVVVLVPCLDAGTVRGKEDVAPVLAGLLQSSSAMSMRSAGEIEHFPLDQGATRAACRMVRMLLSAKAKPPVTCRKPAQAPKDGTAKQRPPISTYLASEEERARSGYPGPEMAGQAGWVSTGPGNGATTEAQVPPPAATPPAAEPPPAAAAAPAGPDADRAQLVALDCEMVLTAAGHALARASLVGPEGAVLYDTLVRPTEPVTDYLTEFSGMTAEKLADVPVTLEDVQAKLLELLTDRNILVGHSLENDLHALRLVHNRVVDTALLYPHPRGWPHRQGLAGLSNNLLKKKLDRRSGHDSVADARAALDLALLKFEKGPGFGALGGEAAPLGRLLRASGVRLRLSDEAGPQPAPASGQEAKASWHLEGCELGEPGTNEVAGEGRQREVRFFVFRDYEALCEHCALEGAGAVEACLKRLDEHVARIAAGLAHDEVLYILSGCGNLHCYRRLKAVQSGAQADARRCAQKTFKDAFGVLAIGGGSLCARLKEAGYIDGPAGASADGVSPVLKRDLVSYDL